MPQGGQVRAVRIAAVHALDSMGTVVEIDRMHAVDAQQQDMLDTLRPRGCIDDRRESQRAARRRGSQGQ